MHFDAITKAKAPKVLGNPNLDMTYAHSVNGT